MTEINITINVLATLISVWICMAIYSVYGRRAKINSYRFRLFALRDQLALGGMGGKISPDSEEFNTMLSLINSTIKHAARWDPFAIAAFFLNVSSQDGLIKTQERLKRLDDKCNELQFLREINREYFLISRGLFYYNIRPKIIIVFISLTKNLSRRIKKWFYIINGAEEFLSKNLSPAH